MKLSTSTQILRAVAILIVAGVFALAGVQKIRSGNPGETMVGRYFTGADGVRALGCIEVGVALWMLSFRNPRLAGIVTAGILAAFGGLIAMELYRERPLPCGCLQTRPGANPFDVRTGLWISLARNVFLCFLALLSAWLTPANDSQQRTDYPER
jgi:hypothetical protein